MVRYFISPILGMLLIAGATHAAADKDAGKKKAAMQMVNAAAQLVVEMTKEPEKPANKKKPAKATPKKPAGKPAATDAKSAAAAKKAAAAKASASAGTTTEDAEVDATRQRAMDEQIVIERQVAAMEEAKEIYAARCVTCHGTNGRGDGTAAAALNPKPRDYTNKAWLKIFGDETLSKAIVEGGAAIGESPLMPPNPDLASKPAVVKALVEMIRTF